MPQPPTLQAAANAQALITTLVNHGVVYTTDGNGEPLFELYSLLEGLELAQDEVAERLRRLRFVPKRLAEPGLYLLYVPLSDVVAHLLPASTLSEIQALQGGCAAHGT